MTIISEEYPSYKHEPKMHPLINKSFVFVPSAGMRLAPEILLLELFREIFFENRYEESIGRELNPDDKGEIGPYSSSERVVLHALRSRRCKFKTSNSMPYFAPAYPALARHGWLGKKRERVINNFLLGGPIAQYLWHKGETEGKKSEQERIIKTLINALIGNKSVTNDNLHGKDILSVAIRDTSFEVNHDIAKENLIKMTSTGNIMTVMKVENDELADCITHDLVALCNLEANIPRMQWLQIFMTFLRFALPMWLLAQMRITSILHALLLDAIDSKKLELTKDIELRLRKRNYGLLHPTLTPTREIYERIEEYMKHRVEINILLYQLEWISSESFANKRLQVLGSGAEVLSVEDLLLIARNASSELKSSTEYKNVAGENNIQSFLTREAEDFAAWRTPLTKGVGKNIDEFLRVLYRDYLGDESGGHLLLPEGRGDNRGFRVFPGQLLMKTITFLAYHNKHAKSDSSGGGRLVLNDVENHFQKYGIDFSDAASARPLLMQELQDMGLLAGSPDAGSSVAVANPY